MTRDDIVRWASEAGATEMPHYDYGARPDRFIMRHEVLERFAALIAAVEREQCAQVCEMTYEGAFEGTRPCFDTAQECAAAIRARGNT